MNFNRLLDNEIKISDIVEHSMGSETCHCVVISESGNVRGFENMLLVRRIGPNHKLSGGYFYP